jgi:uncharacterized protein YeaO (DUF488 family)
MMTKHIVPDDPAERIRTKRIYRAARNSDGNRILVDRLWPRGMSKERARLGGWEKGVAPSDDLRKWFHNNKDGWHEFKARYEAELKERDAELDALTALARAEVVTLLYASADDEHNNAVVLRDVLIERQDHSAQPAPRQLEAASSTDLGSTDLGSTDLGN